MTVNFGALLTDVPAEAKLVGEFVTGVQKLVTDAKAAGLTSVAIADVEALVPEGEAIVTEGEKIAGEV